MNRVATLIKNAIYTVENAGWTKNVSINDQNQVCTIGALDVARNMGILSEPNERDAWLDAYRQAELMVRNEMANRGGQWTGVESIPAINDHPHTTQEDVLLSLKFAHHKAEEL